MHCDKVRIRFRKGGDLRLVSHHDLMQCFERMLRRANLPFRCTQGFNPQPRLVFALSLPLGIVGGDEVVELELSEELPVDELLQRLARQAPAGLEIKSVRRIDAKAHGQPSRVSYRLDVPCEHSNDLPRRISQLLAAAEFWIERTRPRPRRINLRAFLADLRLVGSTLEMDVRVTPQGTVRAEEVLAALGLGNLPDEGVILERTQLELDDEPQSPGSHTVLLEFGDREAVTGPTPYASAPGPIS
jgi:radical SAM-linked protein